MCNKKFKLKFNQVLLTFCFVTASLSASIAHSEALYGPVKYGQTLLEIATEVRPDDSVSIEQFAYAIFKLNPNAFDNNMNVLKAGVKLKFPNKKRVLELSKNQANNMLAQHQREILILRTSAKSLSSAKRVYTKNKQKVKKLRKKLATFKHKSSKWKRTYKKLMFAVKVEKKAASVVKKQRKALLAKAQMEAGTDDTRPSARVDSNTSTDQTHNASIEARILALQTQMKAMISAQKKGASKHNKEILEIKNKLKVSNQNLDKKAKQQEKMEQRVSVLEGELGKKEKIILSLRSTLRTASETMKQQQAENKKLFERLKEINPDDQLLNHNRLELQNVASGTNTNIDTQTTPKTSTDTETAVESATNIIPVKETKTSIASSAKEKPNNNAVNTTAVNATSNATKKQTSSAKLEAALRANKRQHRLNASIQGKEVNSWTSPSYWLSLIKEKPLIMFIFLGSFLLLIFAFLIRKQKTNKKNRDKVIKAIDPEVIIEGLEGTNNPIESGDNIHNFQKVG